ncbi:MAG: AHH domain-containing protein, partial [Pseudomonadota bacterium]
MSNTIIERANTAKLRQTLEQLVSQDDGPWYRDHNTYGGWDKVEIHHVIPEAVSAQFEMLFVQINKHSGGAYAFDLNSTENLVVLPNSADVQATAAGNGHYAAMHLKGDTQHFKYSEELWMKLDQIRQTFHAEMTSGKFNPEQAASRAANRISTVQEETVKGLVGTNQDAVKFYLNNHDRFLIEEYNRKGAANPETGPPIDLGSENTDSLTQAQKQALAQFQQQNYTRIDPDRNLPESINLKNKLASAFDSLANGTVDGPVLILQTALIFEIIREHQIKRGFETFKEAAADYGIDASVEFFRSLVAEEVIDATISAALGPFGLARKIWEVYQSAQGVVSVLELAHARWPENYALSAIVDLIEALSVHSISVDGLDQVLLEIRDGDAGGVIISRELAEKLGPTLSEDKHQLFHFADGTAFYTSNGLAPGQSISLLGPRGFDIIAVLRDNPIVVGVSKSGEKFSIMGQEFLDSYSPYADNSNISKQAVFEAITGYRLFSDSAADGFDQILDQLERAATYDVETNPTILIDRIYADTLKHFGHGHEVFQLSDGQIHRVPGGLEPGEMINLLEGERPGNPHIDPIVSFGLNTDGDQVEITQETHYAIIQIIAELGGDIGEDEALALLTRRATLSEDEIDAELRELLDEPTPGGEAVEATHGLKVPGPTIKSRHAVFSDSDGDGTLDAVTRITTFSDNTQIRQPFKLDPSGELITEERVTLYRVDQALDGEAIGSLFGSQLSNALVGNDLFAEIASGSVLSSVLGNLGEAIDLYFTDNGIDSLFFANQRLGTGEALSFADAVERSIEDFGADVLNNLKSAGISTLSGFLAGELGEALSIDGGFEGQLFQTVTSKTIGTVTNTVIDNAIKISNGSSIDLFHNLNASSLLNAGASAVSSFVGGYLAREIVTSGSQAGAIGGSVGGALGSTIGAGFAGVGFLGSTLGGIGLGSVFGTAFGISLGTIILPGVGAFLGTILGTVLGDLFDDLFNNNGYPKGTANVSL